MLRPYSFTVGHCQVEIMAGDLSLVIFCRPSVFGTANRKKLARESIETLINSQAEFWSFADSDWILYSDEVARSGTTRSLTRVVGIVQHDQRAGRLDPLHTVAKLVQKIDIFLHFNIYILAAFGNTPLLIDIQVLRRGAWIANLPCVALSFINFNCLFEDLQIGNHFRFLLSSTSLETFVFDWDDLCLG